MKDKKQKVLDFIKKQVVEYNGWQGYGLMFTNPKDDIIHIGLFVNVSMVEEIEIKKHELLKFLEQIKEQNNGNKN